MKTYTHNFSSLFFLITQNSSPNLSPPNMALFFFLFFFLFAWFALAILHWSYPGGPAWGKTRAQAKANPIPGPRGYPIIGSITLMLNLAHQNLAAVAEALGAKRLMAFSLGETRVILTCHPDVAKQILNSLAFVDRPVKESAYALLFNRAIGFAPHGLYWRTLRRISANHLFCPSQMSHLESQRLRIASQMVGAISSRQGEFQVRDILKRASLNNMVGLVFGPEYESSFSSNERDELGGLVEEGYELLGQLNWADHLPWLASFDPQKIRNRCCKLVPRVDEIVRRIISERRSRKLLEGQETHQDFADVLLSIDGPDKFSDSDMVAVLWEMVFRGSDTVAVLLEWILARMVLHPKIQSQVQYEIDEALGVGESQKLTESNISKMKYLRAVVKESLRLHPPGPLLSWARLATTDTAIDGHFVPAGTTAMVNMWAIMRDTDIWSDPLNFRPERFMTRQGEMDISVMGSDLRLAPFGSGRRACPGKVLGLTTVSLWVASLLHKFKWVASDHNPVDLSEVLKLSCEMATPLTVKACPRLT